MIDIYSWSEKISWGFGPVLIFDWGLCKGSKDCRFVLVPDSTLFFSCNFRCLKLPDNKPVKLRKHKVIAQAYGNRKKKRGQRSRHISFSFQSSHDDPLGKKVLVLGVILGNNWEMVAHPPAIDFPRQIYSCRVTPKGDDEHLCRSDLCYCVIFFRDETGSEQQHFAQWHVFSVGPGASQTYEETPSSGIPNQQKILRFRLCSLSCRTPVSASWPTVLGYASWKNGLYVLFEFC